MFPSVRLLDEMHALVRFVRKTTICSQALQKIFGCAPVGCFVMLAFASNVHAQVPSEIARCLTDNAVALDPCQIEWKSNRTTRRAVPQLLSLLGPAAPGRDETLFRAEHSAACAFDDGKMVARFSYLGPILEATKAIPKDVPVDEAG